MAQHVLLDNVSHHDLKVSPLFKAEFGDNVNTALTFSTELEAMQRVYPLFFRKDPATHRFQLVAMLGFNKDENLFLNSANHTWQAEVIPAVMAKGPFLIGFQDQSNRGGSDQAPVVHVDMQSPKIDKEAGIPVFLEHGGNSPYLEHINSLLLTIYHGMTETENMLTAFTEMDLIEPVELDITLNNGEQHKLHGNYTISTEKLAALSGEQLQALNQSSYLKAAFFIASSLNNVKKLIAIKNNK
ncbi:MAG: SapC family protein [Paraglaciecola sp.]|uniref:SapC family protein n=1 Tax=Pseudomonadati TaxID=3379134 RepID=UPI00274010F2|nr:SapC family protein [Paraglaciecola sp.]MDP5031842.1 SapC family protein [Paraglaciecola sp.]MDP5132727.1 SapC family protein [Paraglaciecola sp.]